jgi:hypothetical protein
VTSLLGTMDRLSQACYSLTAFGRWDGPTLSLDCDLTMG